MIYEQNAALHSFRQRNRGNILIAVSFIGLFAMALSSGLVGNYAVSEARGVADSLAKLRVYWAMSGHIDYALSRIRQENDEAAGWISDQDENGIQGVLLSYLDELDKGTNCRDTTVTSTQNSRCSSWLYDEISNDYVFHFKWTIYDPVNNENQSTGTANDGELVIRIDYVLEGATDNATNEPTSSISSLDKLSERILDIEYLVCFVTPPPGTGQEIGRCKIFPTSLADASGASRMFQRSRCKYVAGSPEQPGTLKGSLGSRTDNTASDTCILGIFHDPA